MHLLCGLSPCALQCTADPMLFLHITLFSVPIRINTDSCIYIVTIHFVPGLPNGGSRSLASREEVDSSGGFSDRAGLLEESLAPGHQVGAGQGHHGHGHHHGGIIRHHPADRLGDAALNGSPRVTFKSHHETEF